MMGRERFRIFIWQKVVPLAGVPVFVLLLTIWPVTGSWSRAQWTAVAVAGGLAIGAYLLSAWRRATVTLDEEGVTLFHEGTVQTWPWEKLLGVRQYGRYRVRLCVDAGGPAAHQHISVDMWRADAFADALDDWYEERTGRALGDPHAAAA